MTQESSDAAKPEARRNSLRRTFLLALVILGILLAVVALAVLPALNAKPQIRQAEWHQEGAGPCLIREGSEKIFRFKSRGDKVFVPDAPAFHFETNQDFSVVAWIRTGPSFSRSARQLTMWMAAHPGIARFAPKSVTAWLYSHSADNDFGVTPLVDKHQTPSPVESVGFQLYLDYGRLACQLSEAPMRQVGFQNFISPGPNLQDRHWHHVAVSVVRNSSTGGKLYVDGRQVLVFDPTKQSGDLSNSEPLRIGNHANPSLRCYFRGSIGNVAIYRRALRAEEIAASYRNGR